jgi:hypothetical protein
LRPHPEAALADPFARLDRRPAGSHLLGLPDLVLRLETRSARPVPEVLPGVGEDRALRDGRVRRPARMAQAEPNAPQLIRVVKTPFGLSTTWPRRRRARDPRERLRAPGRERPIALVTAALARPEGVRPGHARPRPTWPRVPRDLALRYLESQVRGTPR